MVWFSDIQIPFSISPITTPGCILCTAKLKHFIPLTCNFGFILTTVITWGRTVYMWKTTLVLSAGIITLHSSFMQICTHTYPWWLNPWHLMHRHTSTHILKNHLCWSPFAQMTGLEAIWLNFFHRREIFGYLRVESTQCSWIRFSTSQFFALVKIRSWCHENQCGRLTMNFFIHVFANLDHSVK